jgi:hypothetical protein
MSRRLVVTIALVFSLVAVTVGSAGADIIGGGGDDDVLPLPALPLGANAWAKAQTYFNGFAG